MYTITHRFLKLTSLSFFFLTINMWSQDDMFNSSNGTYYRQLNVKSPGVTDFIRYGNTPSPSYTGSIDLNIPLISIPNRNQKPIDISISYNSSGFIPSKRPGIVGLNWFLNMGGVITRQVNNVPDDWYGYPLNGNPGDVNGFLVGVRNHSYTVGNVYSMDSSTGYISPAREWLLGGGTANAQSYESMPDLFQFNFNGITGKFFIANDGSVKVVTNQPQNLVVDITGVPTQYTNNCTPSNSEIKITDNLGNQYFFGGTPNNLEYDVSLGGENTGHVGITPHPVITSWFLRQIIYNDKSVVNFNYRAANGLTVGYCIGNGTVSAVNKPLVSLNQYIYEERDAESGWMTPGYPSTYSGPAGTTTYELQKKAILDNIDGPDFTVLFSYSAQSYKFNRTFTSTFEFEDNKLDRITLKDKATTPNTIKTVDFNYVYLGGTYNRMFLNSITESGKNPYTFEYSVTKNFPDPSTKGIDYWGFWNGLDGQNSLIPSINYNLNGDFSYTTAVREPSFTFSKEGLLSKVIYPTKGYTRFEYEAHQYSQRLERPRLNNFLPQLVSLTGIAGGARVSKIVNNDGISDTNIREFKYVKNYDTVPGSALSSGTLLQWPRYVIYWEESFGSSIAKYLKIKSSSVNRNIFEGSVITYSEVVETNNGEGFTINKYKDYSNNPDVTGYGIRELNLGSNTITPLELYKNITGIFYNDVSIERGKLLSSQVYDNANAKVAEDSYVYNNDASRFNNYSCTIHTTGRWAQVNKLFYYNDYLTQKLSTKYLNGSPVTTTENYQYDSFSNLKTISSLNSFGELMEKKSYFPVDPSMNSEPQVTTMLAKYMTGIKLNEENYKASQMVSQRKIQYGSYTSDNPSDPNLLPQYQFSRKDNISAGLERNETYNYDKKGNLVELTRENGTTVTLLWGYSKTQPIAKIENATNAQVAAALGVSDLYSVTEANMAGIDNLRANALLSSGAITTYTYIPLVGVSSITDSKGDKTTFEYDAYGRLKTVKDKNGNYLNEYEYNYKP